MPLIARELREVWDALRASKAHRDEALPEVRIRRLRGIRDLRLPFDYPVSVLAGPNGSGKSTVLFACACAYRVPGRGPRELAPGALFPNFTSRQLAVSSDTTPPTELEFHYLHQGERLSTGSAVGRGTAASRAGTETANRSGRSTCGPSPTSPVPPKSAAFCNSGRGRSEPGRSTLTC